MLFDSAIDPAFSTDLFVKGLDWGAPQMEQLGANRTVGGPLPVAAMMPNIVSYYSYSGYRCSASFFFGTTMHARRGRRRKNALGVGG